MIKIENTKSFGWEYAIKGMRNPMNSWKAIDSAMGYHYDMDGNYNGYFDIDLGEKDLKLMKTLIRGGGDERKFLRMIHVQVDITAPLYWWKEFDTYKIGTVVNSCSTMHKIHAKEFCREDFSIEHLNDSAFTGEIVPTSIFDGIITCLNQNRQSFLATKDKKYWWQMIQMLPSCYNQTRTVDINYEVLLRMYPKRKNHKLDEWHTFCDWVESLPNMAHFIVAQDSVAPYHITELRTALKKIRKYIPTEIWEEDIEPILDF